ncbi:tetratricopeptide repeat protein [Thermospira aquatica]|uniref:Tetratricopeptide repeat protein n=1 Tax=Thermospira aquatica TaxID=2828656 RepID=A0AAX3BBL7_9SPIR|nr:tetratricopeptide repeat protein [Thermospira aquatica]URA09707.1 tetratricopeptide repeat protein [Thermospira aquatica]
MKRKIFLGLLLSVVVFTGCSGNPTLRSDVKKSIERQSLSGITAFRRGEYESAMSFFEEALQLAYQLYLPAEIIKQYANLAEISLRLGQLDKAGSFLVAAETIAGKEKLSSFDLLLVKARFYQEKKDISQAQKIYEEVVQIAKTKSEKILARIHYADLWIASTNWNEAQRILDEAWWNLFLFSDNDILGLYYYQRGVVAQGKKEYDKAIQEFKKALIYDRRAENLEGIVKDILRLGEVYALKNDEAWSNYYQEMAKILLDKNQNPR